MVKLDLEKAKNKRSNCQQPLDHKKKKKIIREFHGGKNLLLLYFGERNGNPLWYPCQENSMGRGAWQVTVYGVENSWT